MCIDAPESTTNSRSSGVFEVGAGIALTSQGEKNVVLSEFLSLQLFSPSPMLLCGRILLGARSPFPKFNLVPGDFGEFDGVFRSHHSKFTLNRFSRTRILRRTTQLYRLLQYRLVNTSFALSLR